MEAIVAVRPFLFLLLFFAAWHELLEAKKGDDEVRPSPSAYYPRSTPNNFPQSGDERSLGQRQWSYVFLATKEVCKVHRSDSSLEKGISSRFATEYLVLQ
ncbi:hypothetical protein ACFE04_029301 [Oxalis oulophora]